MSLSCGMPPTRTDLYFQVGCELARAALLQTARVTDKQKLDMLHLRGAAILEIEKKSEALSEVSTWSETIKKNSEKILEHVRRCQLTQQQLATLNEATQSIKDLLDNTAG